MKTISAITKIKFPQRQQFFIFIKTFILSFFIYIFIISIIDKTTEVKDKYFFHYIIMLISIFTTNLYVSFGDQKTKESVIYSAIITIVSVIQYGFLTCLIAYFLSFFEDIFLKNTYLSDKIYEFVATDTFALIANCTYFMLTPLNTFMPEKNINEWEQEPKRQSH